MCRFRDAEAVTGLGRLVFQYIKCAGSARISFNDEITLNLFQYIKCAGSAERKKKQWTMHELFQYIKCAGSAMLRPLPGWGDWYFNTSNVPVPLNCQAPLLDADSLFQYIKCIGSAESLKSYIDATSIFQYIKCAGSAYVTRGIDNPRALFQYIKCAGSAISIVCPPLLDGLISIHQMCRFRLDLLFTANQFRQISIHQMCRFRCNLP
ncbi:hypothetical protein Swol_1801 [Syntrophomonas wolfei subsp. wolfei str. Goettingen G311]|uniref:Uncharacterized protein n=1 Tax=Syntrophomonas wolfei subsp. wolfei (strain DSM 2245B / Goettingen) TaxID=335541 RepID=Q0AW05_SYNWW|nr:hypothetical protein Swol_1801 [Syntrophomonas wolfei subsp. wolfei str. Goettingen G311]